MIEIQSQPQILPDRSKNRFIRYYCYLSETVFFLCIIGSYSWIFAHYSNLGYIQVVGFFITLKLWELILLSSSSFLIFLNSLIYAAVKIDSNYIYLIRLISIPVYILGAFFSVSVAPWGKISILVLDFPFFTTGLVFFLKQYRTGIRNRIEKRKEYKQLS